MRTLFFFLAEIRAALVRQLNVSEDFITLIPVHNSAASLGWLGLSTVFIFEKLKNTWTRSIPVRCSKFLRPHSSAGGRRTLHALCTPFAPVPPVMCSPTQLLMLAGNTPRVGSRETLGKRSGRRYIFCFCFDRVEHVCAPVSIGLNVEQWVLEKFIFCNLKYPEELKPYLDVLVAI